jgi:hypothetical protein
MPTRPYGILPDPHEFARSQPDPGWNRPDVPYSPPAPGYNSNTWHPDGPPAYPWMGVARPKKTNAGTRIAESYLLAYVKEITRVHANQYLDLAARVDELVLENMRLRKQIDTGSTPRRLNGAA